MLPGPYERWYTEMAGRASPVEARSTCDSCVMEPGSPGLPPEGAFDPALRCCTYHPHLAPHLVGGIIRAGGSEAGRAVVRARIAAREAVTPLGLGPTPTWEATYQRVTAVPGTFGHSREILCPFLAESRCTIWEHRGAPCAAFHCKFDRGAYGAGLWQLIVIAFNAIERALARWLLVRQGLEVKLCDDLLHAPGDRALDQRAWGSWFGREEAYFVAAAELIAPMSWADVVAIGGRELSELGPALRGAVARFAAMAPPARVQRGGDVLYRLGRAGHTVLQHSAVPFDVLEVPTPVADRLQKLQPGPLADLVSELGLDDDLVRRLLDWQVLLPAP